MKNTATFKEGAAAGTTPAPVSPPPTADPSPGPSGPLPTAGPPTAGPGPGLAPDPVPWPGPVNGSALLDDLAATLRRFVFAPDDAITAASLFVLHTYAFDLGDISPVLFITGDRRTGKSRLLTLLSRLVSRPFIAASASPAAIYHSIELHRPTLCLDDVDSFVRSRDQLRALVNSGARDRAFHLAWSRGSAKTGQPGLRPWSTWTPRIFSGVGKVAEAARDCAIAIGLTRPPAAERREYLRHRTRFEDLRRKILRFVNDHAEALRTARPSLPDDLGDPAADHWTPLLAIADLAGGNWPVQARRAAIALSKTNASNPSDDPAALISDLRLIFVTDRTNRLSSRDLADRLAALEGRPWAEFGKQRRPISTTQLADLLRKLGIFPRPVRIGDQTPRGYNLSDFKEAYAQYCRQPHHGAGGNSVFGAKEDPSSSTLVKVEAPSEAGPNASCESTRNTATTPDNIDQNNGFESATTNDSATPRQPDRSTAEDRMSHPESGSPSSVTVCSCEKLPISPSIDPDLPDFDQVICIPTPEGDIEYWLGGRPGDPHAVRLPENDPRSAEALLADLQKYAQLHLTGKSIPPRSTRPEGQTTPTTSDSNQTTTETPPRDPSRTELPNPSQPSTAVPSPSLPAASPKKGHHPFQTKPKPNLFRLPLPRPQKPVFTWSAPQPTTGPSNQPPRPSTTKPSTHEPSGNVPPQPQPPTASQTPPTAVPSPGPSPHFYENSPKLEPSPWELAIRQLQQLTDPTGNTNQH